MKKIGELKQNSDEWHEWRKSGLGASESNIIMGVSKFMTPHQLWEQKVFGRKEDDSSGNFITNKGHRLEEISRPLFEMEMGYDFPDTIVVSDKFPFLRASLDGFNEEINSCWECKFVGQEDFEKVKSGMILPQYYPQLQHQLMVSNADKNYLFVITDDAEKKGTSFPYKTACVEVLPDPHYIKSDLLPALFSFWNLVTTKTEPSLCVMDIADQSDDKDLSEMLEHYKVSKEMLDRYKELCDELSDSIFKSIKHDKVMCNGVKITKSKSDSKIVFDYKKFEKENEISDIYMKKQAGRITKRITFPKS